MVNWEEIDTVLLDMDGTLLDLHFDNHFWQYHLPSAYARKHAMTHQEAEEIVFSQFANQYATLNWYCLDYWSKQLGLDIIDLKREVQHLIAIRPGALEFLQFLQKKGKRTVLVTNAHRDSLNLKMELTGIAPLLTRLISAHDFGYPKEEQAFWKTLAAKERFKPERTLFIDDTPAILDAAERFGVGHVLAIHRPDSRAAPRPRQKHRQIHDFGHLMGGLNSR